jgi:hypothetical protein
MATRKDVRRELDRVAELVENALKQHEQEPDHGNRPFICENIGQVSRCTDSAVYLAARLGGVVYGYTIEDNPEAKVGGAEGGHDFALIGDRWLVDFWAKDTYQLPDLYDLEDPMDRMEVRREYGDRSKWTRMTPENFAYYRKFIRDVSG